LRIPVKGEIIMKCSICGSDNVARSHRRGLEKFFRYIIPRTPYRCKECWGRFWIFENPFRKTAVRIAGGCILCILLLIFVWPLLFGQKEKSWKDQIKNDPRTEIKPATSPDMQTRAGKNPESSAAPVSAGTEKTAEPDPAGKNILFSADRDSADNRSTAEKNTAQAVSPAESSLSADTVSASGPPEEKNTEKENLPETADIPEKQKNSGQKGKKETAAFPHPGKGKPEKTAPENKKESPKPAFVQTAKTEKQSSLLPRTEKAGGDKKTGDTGDRSEPLEKKAAGSKNIADIEKEIRELKKIETRSGKESFEMHILTDGPVRHHTFFPLTSPPKLVVDLPGKWKHRGAALYKVQNDMVSRVRVGLHPEFIRVVMDLKVSPKLHPVFSESKEGLRVKIKSGTKQ
jgi:hypothetical protein